MVTASVHAPDCASCDQWAQSADTCAPMWSLVCRAVRLFEATELIGESTEQALNEAEGWAIQHGEIPER